MRLPAVVHSLVIGTVAVAENVWLYSESANLVAGDKALKCLQDGNEMCDIYLSNDFLVNTSLDDGKIALTINDSSKTYTLGAMNGNLVAAADSTVLDTVATVEDGYLSINGSSSVFYACEIGVYYNHRPRAWYPVGVMGKNEAEDDILAACEMIELVAETEKPQLDAGFQIPNGQVPGSLAITSSLVFYMPSTTGSLDFPESTGTDALTNTNYAYTAYSGSDSWGSYAPSTTQYAASLSSLNTAAVAPETSTATPSDSSSRVYSGVRTPAASSAHLESTLAAPRASSLSPQASTASSTHSTSSTPRSGSRTTASTASVSSASPTRRVASASASARSSVNIATNLQVGSLAALAAALVYLI